MNKLSPRKSSRAWVTPLIVTVSIFMVSIVTHGQVLLTAKRNVRVHAEPALKSKTTDGLTSGTKVTLVEGQAQGKFFKVKLSNEKTGWVHGHYLLLPAIEERPFGVEETVLAPSATTSGFPLCGPERHYRWQEKITTSGFDQTPTKPSVNTALNWAPLSFSGHDVLSWCTERTAKENKVYSILGWVRRTRKEDDGDIHIEITQTATAAVEDCLVVEIPAAELSPRFSKARADLLSLLGLSVVADKDFDSPKRVRFTGLAFWDGWHATSGLPSKHGRCNSTKGAPWELHPVFKVEAP